VQFRQMAVAGFEGFRIWLLQKCMSLSIWRSLPFDRFRFDETLNPDLVLGWYGIVRTNPKQVITMVLV
jgi:hypothetical protein